MRSATVSPLMGNGVEVDVAEVSSCMGRLLRMGGEKLSGLLSTASPITI